MRRAGGYWKRERERGEFDAGMSAARLECGDVEGWRFIFGRVGWVKVRTRIGILVWLRENIDIWY